MLDTKKGDVIERRREIPKGYVLIGNIRSEDAARDKISEVFNYWNLPRTIGLDVGVDEANTAFAVIAGEDTYETQRAKINWRVDHEVGATLVNSGGSVLFDLNELEVEGWVVVESAAPEYQSTVAHMTEDQLRESIDELRHARVSQPPAQRKMKTKRAAVPKVKMCAADKKLSGVLNGMSEEAKIALKRKLGMLE